MILYGINYLGYGEELLFFTESRETAVDFAKKKGEHIEGVYKITLPLLHLRPKKSYPGFVEFDDEESIIASEKIY